MKKKPLIFRILLAIWIIQKKKDTNERDRYRFNPYNPLSYLIIVVLFFISVFWEGVPESIDGLKKVFNWD